ncbi:MAG: MFS transporter [Dehalococcoidia bacterium]|nr:MFS transporter [Dehalococcoidia bacterium]
MASAVRSFEAQAGAHGWRAAFASLEHRQFRWMYASNLAFFFAMNGQFVVRSYLAFKLTDNAFSLGLVNLAVAVPLLLISPFGGVVSDRVEKRRLIMAGQALVVVNELAVLVLLVTDLLRFWHLLAAVFVMGCLFPFMMPARSSIVSNIVGRQGLANAMALQFGGINAARVVGPVTAGLMIAVVGLRWMYAIAVVLYGVALLAMSRIDRAPPADGAGDRTVWGELGEGVSYVWNDRPVRALMSLALVPILLAMPFQALLVVFAEDVWKVGGGGLGVLQAAAGVGGILGSVFVAWRGDSPRKLRMMVVSLLAFAGTLMLFAISPWFLLALPLVLASDVFASVFNTVNNTAIQVIIPDHVRGRVMSLMMMTFGLTPLGLLPVSALAEAMGAPFAVAVSAGLTAVATLAFLFWSRSLREVDQASREAISRNVQPAATTPAPAEQVSAAS